MKIIIFDLYVTIYEIFAVKMCMTLTFRMDQGPRSNVNMPIKSPYTTSYLMAIVMYALLVTIYKIFTIEICTTLTLSYRMRQDLM